MGSAWIEERIIELTLACIQSCVKRAAKSIKSKDKNNEKHAETVSLHLESLAAFPCDIAVCYTDGSAIPNPGPSGAGATIFLQKPDLVIDIELHTGISTNNCAELAALLGCLLVLTDRHHVTKFSKAIILCDSQYAIRQVTSAKKPITNTAFVNAGRKAMAKALAMFAVDIQWLKGHAQVGGNERADRLAKRAAQTNPGRCTFDDVPTLSAFSINLNPWPYGYPLNVLPSSCFLALPPPVTSALA
jgi:ribonuclease HI